MYKNKRLLIGLLVVTTLFIASCVTETQVEAQYGILSLIGIPEDMKSVILTLETEQNSATFERSVQNGCVGPIDLGPEFAGRTYAPKQIHISTFDSNGQEVQYENSEPIEIKCSTEVQEISLDTFCQRAKTEMETQVEAQYGILSLIGIPEDMKSVILTLETEHSIVTFERSVQNGCVGPIDLGPEFAGRTYAPGQIHISTFDSNGQEVQYENSEPIEIKCSTEVQEISLDTFCQIS